MRYLYHVISQRKMFWAFLSENPHPTLSWFWTRRQTPQLRHFVGDSRMMSGDSGKDIELWEEMGNSPHLLLIFRPAYRCRVRAVHPKLWLHQREDNGEWKRDDKGTIGNHMFRTSSYRQPLILHYMHLHYICTYLFYLMNASLHLCGASLGTWHSLVLGSLIRYF